MGRYRIESQVLDDQPTAACTARLQPDEIGRWLADVLPNVVRHLGRAGAGPTGPPYARFHRLEAGRFDVEAGFPAASEVEGGDGVQPSHLPGGLVATTVHVGSYDDMEPAYEELAEWLDERGGVADGDAWEIYESDPETEPDPSTWRTEIIQPYHRARRRRAS